MMTPDLSALTVSAEVESIEAFNLAVRQTGWDTHIRQLDLQARPVRFSACAGPALTVLEVTFPNRTHQLAAPPGNQLTFGIPSVPQPDLKIGNRAISSETITCFTDGVESVSEPQFSAYTLSLEAERLSQSATALGYEREAAFRAESRLLPFGMIEQIRRDLAALLEAGSNDAVSGTTRSALFSNFEAELPATIVRLWQAGRMPAPAGRAASRRRVVKRATELLATDAARRCRIEDLCVAAACSQRTLERSFREAFGVTPKQYLNRLRLAGVHRALLDAEEQRTIGDLAAHWGFWHLSQFAANYRAMYGELPSETAQRIRT